MANISEQSTAAHRGVRRGLLGAIGAAAVVAASARAAQAAEPAVQVEVLDPPFDPETYEPRKDVPVYRHASGDQVRVRASLPEALRVHNGSSAPVPGPTVELVLTMRDYGTDYAPVGANQIKATCTTEGVRVREVKTPVGSRQGSRFLLECTQSIPAGGTLELPLRYFEDPLFANVDFNLLVDASVAGAAASRKVGFVPGFTG